MLWSHIYVWPIFHSLTPMVEEWTSPSDPRDGFISVNKVDLRNSNNVIFHRVFVGRFYLRESCTLPEMNISHLEKKGKSSSNMPYQGDMLHCWSPMMPKALLLKNPAIRRKGAMLAWNPSNEMMDCADWRTKHVLKSDEGTKYFLLEASDETRYHSNVYLIISRCETY